MLIAISVAIVTVVTTIVTIITIVTVVTIVALTIVSIVTHCDCKHCHHCKHVTIVWNHCNHIVTIVVIVAIVISRTFVCFLCWCQQDPSIIATIVSIVSHIVINGFGLVGGVPMPSLSCTRRALRAFCSLCSALYFPLLRLAALLYCAPRVRCSSGTRCAIHP